MRGTQETRAPGRASLSRLLRPCRLAILDAQPYISGFFLDPGSHHVLGDVTHVASAPRHGHPEGTNA